MVLLTGVSLKFAALIFVYRVLARQSVLICGEDKRRERTFYNACVPHQ